MRKIIQANFDDISGKLDTWQEQINEFTQLREDISYDGEDTNVFTHVLDSRIKICEENRKNGLKFKDILQGCLDELDKYKCASDLVKHMRQYQQSSTSTNSTYTNWTYTVVK